MTKTTAIITTLTEESNIQKALDSVVFADKVIVIDSFNSDKTIEVVEKSKAILLQREFDDFSSQKNHAISKASNNWVFILDADEEILDELKKEILLIKGYVLE